jgi:hypothetical protein
MPRVRVEDRVRAAWPVVCGVMERGLGQVEHRLLDVVTEFAVPLRELPEGEVEFALNRKRTRSCATCFVHGPSGGSFPRRTASDSVWGHDRHATRRCGRTEGGTGSVARYVVARVQ